MKTRYLKQSTIALSIASVLATAAPLSALDALLVSLTGCASNSASDVAVSPVRDAYISAVQTITAKSSEDTEAASIGALAATLPEDTEPVNL